MFEVKLVDTKKHNSKYDIHETGIEMKSIRRAAVKVANAKWE